MRTVYLKVTRRCNLRCAHCFIQDYRGDMPLAIVERVAELFPTSVIVFHGGEPTMMGLPYILDCIKILGARPYVLQSNMINFSSQWLPLLMEHFDGAIGTSLDDARFPHLQRWLNNVAIAANAGIKVTAVVTVTPRLTVRALSQALQQFQEAGGRAFRLQFVTPVKTQAISPESYREFFTAFYDHPLNEARHRIDSALCLGFHNGINGGNCGGSLRTIEPDGTVYVCPDLAGQSLFPLGNVMRPGEGNVKNDTLFFRRQTILSLKCDDDCWRLCRGGCLASAYFHHGEPMEKDPYCSIYKGLITFTRGEERISCAG